jgi:hypothetical protein
MHWVIYFVSYEAVLADELCCMREAYEAKLKERSAFARLQHSYLALCQQRSPPAAVASDAFSSFPLVQPLSSRPRDSI